MAPLLHQQPWKSLYLFGFVLHLFIKIPYWILTSIPRKNRPRPTWSIKKCVNVYILRRLTEFPVKLGVVIKRDLTIEVSDATLKNAKFAWIPGLKEARIKGELKEYAEKAGVTPVKIPGYWQYKPGTVNASIEPPKEGEKVIYHLHGGSLYLGSAHPSDTTARIPRGILKKSKCIARTFAIDYRLCASEPFVPEHPFPSALLDCLAGYQYLLDLGFSSENIIFAGDSAGGNLCLATIRYIVQQPEAGMPVPGALLLCSPWGDLTHTRVGENDSMISNMHTDIFAPRPPSQKSGYAARSYIRNVIKWEEVEMNAYLSPASQYLKNTEGLYKGFPKTYILVGSAERLLDDSKIIAERMSNDNSAGGWVSLDIVEDEIHDFIIFPWCEPSRTEAFTRITTWIDNL